MSVINSTAKQKPEVQAQVYMFLHFKHVKIQISLLGLPLSYGSSTASEHGSTWSVFPSQVRQSSKRYHMEDIPLLIKGYDSDSTLPEPRSRDVPTLQSFLPSRTTISLQMVKKLLRIHTNTPAACYCFSTRSYYRMEHVNSLPLLW